MRKFIILAGLLAGCARHPKSTVTVGAYTGDKITWIDNHPIKYVLEGDPGVVSLRDPVADAPSYISFDTGQNNISNSLIIRGMDRQPIAFCNIKLQRCWDLKGGK